MALSKRKAAFIAGSTAAVVGIGALGSGAAMAATTTRNKPNDIVDAISNTFHLNKADVQKVFDENRSQHQAERQAELKARLDQAVKDGKLSQEQENKLLAKLQELKTFRESLTNKTPEEVREAMKQKRQELRQWAKDNNIPLEFLGPGMTHMHGNSPPEHENME